MKENELLAVKDAPLPNVEKPPVPDVVLERVNGVARIATRQTLD